MADDEVQGSDDPIYHLQAPRVRQLRREKPTISTTSLHRKQDRTTLPLSRSCTNRLVIDGGLVPEPAKVVQAALIQRHGAGGGVGAVVHTVHKREQAPNTSSIRIWEWKQKGTARAVGCGVDEGGGFSPGSQSKWACPLAASPISLTATQLRPNIGRGSLNKPSVLYTRIDRRGLHQYAPVKSQDLDLTTVSAHNRSSCHRERCAGVPSPNSWGWADNTNWVSSWSWAEVELAEESWRIGKAPHSPRQLCRTSARATGRSLMTHPGNISPLQACGAPTARRRLGSPFKASSWAGSR